jgi:CorA-like Mg2+ transporter protein
MESRASTRLGENVKLLTFVSIFFLPLSFCTSLWSINDQILPSSALAITITLMAIFTYLIVFNLNTLANLSKRIYRKQRSRLIESMSTDTDSGWQEKGRRLKSFQPRQESENPSEWQIVMFLCRKLGRGFLWRQQGSGGSSKVKSEARGGNGGNPGHEEEGQKGVDTTESVEQNTEQVTGDTAVRSSKDPHSLFKMFTRDKLRQKTRAEEV